MNLQLHHVISDITGVTGVAILEAILAGERNPHTLAALRDRRIKASADTIAKSLVGDYRREHLFTLGQSLEALPMAAVSAFRHYQELIAACDREIAQYLKGFESKVDPPPIPTSPSKDGSEPKASEPRFETVAMESTGVYWIPLFQILEARGFTVFLVNAHPVKNVPGRKSDVSDFTLSFPRHGSLSGFGFVHARRPRLCTRSTLLNEINVPW